MYRFRGPWGPHQAPPFGPWQCVAANIMCIAADILRNAVNISCGMANICLPKTPFLTFWKFFIHTYLELNCLRDKKSTNERKELGSWPIIQLEINPGFNSARDVHSCSKHSEKFLSSPCSLPPTTQIHIDL